MTPEDFAKLLSDEPLSPYAAYFREIARPCVDFRFTDRPVEEDQSRLGGAPFVPADFVWPEHEMGEYRFVGQVNFAELEAPPSPLPSSGLLSFFYAHDEDGEIFWGDPGYVLAFYWPDLTDFCVQSGPNPGASDGLAIRLDTGVQIPANDDVLKDPPFAEATLEDLVYEAPHRVDMPGEYLLGYPTFNTLAYDPTPEGGWVSLLTLGSLDELDWCWHDGDKLMVFIEEEKLAALDFSNLICDAG